MFLSGSPLSDRLLAENNTNMEFSIPWLSLAGGIVLGTSCLLLLLLNGKIAGISGILGGLFTRNRQDGFWRGLFLLGLMIGGWLTAHLLNLPVPKTYDTSSVHVVLAGLLVGFGAAMGNGCTSGHGICGMGRFSPRSIVATLVFMATAGITVFFRLHVF